LNDQDFKFFEEMLFKESGLVISSEKLYLLESRLLPIAKKKGLSTLEELVKYMRTSVDNILKYDVVEAMTTNETSFFRDSTPFDRLKQNLLPYFVKARGTTKSLKLWSAACSSGQEPYSLAMLLREFLSLQGWHMDILATDLSKEILSRAQEGIYSQFEIQRGLPIQFLVKYFTQDDDRWVVNDALKNMIRFQQINLLTDIKNKGPFDIIFCRNVLIYFDVATKSKVLADIKTVLKPDGILFLGGAETVIGISDEFKPMPKVKGVYVRSDSTLELPE